MLNHACNIYWSRVRPYLSSVSLGLLGLFVALFLSSTGAATAQQIPTFTIVSVARDQAVQIRTANFPANTEFVVRMGAIGTRAINGVQVGFVNSGAGGAVDFSLVIPAVLANQSQIAIRLESRTSGHFSYNWFFNTSTAVAPALPILGDPGATFPGSPPVAPAPPSNNQGIPTFSITAVDRNNSVQILTNNFPANTDFTVRLGYYGTQALNGVQVGFVNSGSGGTINWSFVVPAVLANQGRIAIRLEAHTGGYYAFNWFFNNSTAVLPQLPILGDPGANFPGGGTGGGPAVPPAPVPPVVQPPAYPNMFITNVVRNQSVTARVFNLSSNTNCAVQMGPHGSTGFGFGVGSFNTNMGGTQDLTFTIPPQLANSYRIALRFDCANGTFAFNWFYNNTASVPAP